ncbi:hypothetical protein K4F52_006230 [Lecanicillium sp. MT-2017a]|nr:hypothetical protein K4F52_006230 [Lecanicillium sp. MT-2017a]
MSTRAPGMGDSTQTTSTPQSDRSECTSSSQSPSPRRARRIAKGSLLDIMRSNAGVSLFLRPICWTDTHSQLLGIKFKELPPCNAPLPVNEPGSPPSKGHLRPSHTITTLSETLTEILVPSVVHPVILSNAMKTILSTLWPNSFRRPQFVPELHLFFGDRVYRDAVRAQLMWNYPPDSAGSSQTSFKSISTRPAESQSLSISSSSSHNMTGLPMMCYIGKAQLASIRQNMFRIVPGPDLQGNVPVYRLQQLRSRSLLPDDSDQDVHIAGIFLGMAQRHFYGATSSSFRRDTRWHATTEKRARPQFRDIKLRILSHDSDEAEFIVYTGHITAQFLERFHRPHRAFYEEDGEKIAGLTIEYTKVPIWPILGLRERLGKALGEDVVGQFNPEVMETWEDEEAEQAKPSGHGKRKRSALSEVFNGSFDESEEEPTSPLKKRLREGPPLEVVA